jgi:hypothetical protein
MLRLKHSIIYAKRAIYTVYRRVKRLFFGDSPKIKYRTRKMSDELCPTCSDAIDNIPSSGPGGYIDLCYKCTMNAAYEYIVTNNKEK